MLLTAVVYPTLFGNAAAAFDLGTSCESHWLTPSGTKHVGLGGGMREGEVCFVLEGFFFFYQTSLNSHSASLLSDVNSEIAY